MKNIFKKTIFILCVIFIVSCSDDDDTSFIPDTTTILDFVTDNDDYSMLLTALEITGLDVTLNGTDSFTVFAPNNAAFTAFLNGMALEDVPVETLSQILLNHVLVTTAVSTDLTTGYVQTLAEESNTAANFSMYIDTTNGVVINGESTVIMADIMTDNGVIHVVDTVISLPTMFTFVTLDPRFSTLATIATTTEGFITDFGAVLEGEDSDLTLLAPDNDAFIALGDISGVAIEDLEQILLNHVISGFNVSGVLSTGYSNTLAIFGDTANNLSLYINTDGGGISFNGISLVNVSDIVTANGIIHGVDTVITLPTIVTFAIADPTFSTLENALTTLTPSTDFVSILNTENTTDPAPFTVFAPTNTAFDAIEPLSTDENVITEILQHHVISMMNLRSADLTNGTITALNGDVTIDAIAPSVTGETNMTPSNITVTDVQASNGVIHVIDQVLLPVMD